MVQIKAPLGDEYMGKPYESQSGPLSRFDLANQLTSLFKNLDHGTVSILNGRWGSGKSTFARKFIHHLKKDQISVTYFDAFANDYSDSPFLALSAHMLREIDKRGNKSLSVSKSIKEKSRAVAKKIGSASARVAIKAISLGALDGSDFEQLASEIADAGGDVAESAIEEFSKNEDAFEEFRESLDGLAKALSEENDEDHQGKTVFIIDELDRCRPDFALGILEIVKHLFDNKNIHFIFVTNLDYLVASVNAKYGLGDASAEYLEKFYDFVIFFEQASAYESEHAAAALISDRLRALNPGNGSHEFADLRRQLEAFARAFNLSLRQASALATNAALSFLTYRKSRFRPPVLIALLALYRCRFPELYQSIKSRTFTRDALLSVFDGISVGSAREHDRLISIIEFYASQPNEINRDDPRYRGYDEMTFGYNYGDYLNILPDLANSVMDNFAVSGDG